MKLAILGDIHSNSSALNAVLRHISQKYDSNVKLALMGDYINYGGSPNETVQIIRDLFERNRVFVGLEGNHEKALKDLNTDKFSAERGKQALIITKNALSERNKMFLSFQFEAPSLVKNIAEKKILFIHGSLEDPYWKSLDFFDSISDDYLDYSYVISAHSHKPHFFEYVFNQSATKNTEHKTIFINPGSVGQPRNGNALAQYCVLDTISESISFEKVHYNLLKAQKEIIALGFNSYYSDRLSYGK